MAKLSSQPVIAMLKKRFEKKFIITTEAQNKFYFDDAYYSPDLVLWNKMSKKVMVIIEVEQGTRKHVVGGIITADYCMGKLRQRPLMMILALTEQDRKDYVKRMPMMKKYARHIRKLYVGDISSTIRLIQHIK